MALSIGQRAAGAALATAAIFLLAPAAWAAPRYASPAGSGSACTSGSPCGIVTAVNSASNGDEVIVNSGDYGSPGPPISTQITVNNGVEVHGAAGPRPRVFSSTNNGVWVSPGGKLRDIEIVHSGAGNGLYLLGETERVIVRSTGTTACAPTNGSTLRDSICVNTGLGFRYAVSISCSGCTGPGVFRNVTAYSENGVGLRVSVGDGTQLVVNATNVIAHGGDKDLSVVTSGTTGPMSATVNLDHSNYATVDATAGAGGSVSVTPAGFGTNQNAAPAFVNTFTGDFHQAAGSPTIDAGVSDAANGTADVDGEARNQGAVTDIGADEYPAPAPCACVPTNPATPDKTKPTMSIFDVKPYAFAPVRHGPSVLAAKRKRPRGATVIYSLSEAATVTYRVDQIRHRRCRPSKRGRVRRCAYYKRLKGSFTNAGAGGANSFRFSGRLRGKALKRGRYRLVGKPKDPAGNVGKSVRTSFRIVRG